MGGRTARRDMREVGGAWASFQTMSFTDPAPDLARFVAHYWGVRWDLRGQPPYRQLIVPYPRVQLTFVDGAAGVVHGVPQRYVERTLAGVGRVFGVAFRPGCFRPFLGAPVAGLTDRSVPAHEVFGPGVPRPPAGDGAADADLRVAVEAFLRARAPGRDPTAEAVAATVERIAAEPDIHRVDELADRIGTGVRRLQRLFAEYVGVGPKWVIRRYRLHEVTERMARGAAVDWAALAAELGYADQAHLTRDFTAMVGEPPTRYAARYPAAPARVSR